MGRVNAGDSAAADEPATIFFNPAGLIQLWRDSPNEHYIASVNAHLIIPRGEIRNSGSVAASPGTLGNFVGYNGGDTKDPIGLTPIPNLYWTTKLTDRGAVGVGFNAPFGLATSSSSSWFGRYDAVEASLLTANVSIVGAYDIIQSKVSIGGGIDVQNAQTKLVTAIPNPLVPGGPSAATDGRAETTGHAWTTGFNVGLLLTPNPDTRVGLHYRSSMVHKLTGSTTISGLAGSVGDFDLASANGSEGTHADFDLPAIATLGLWQKIGQWVLLGEVEWDGWSTFKEIRIRFDNGQPDQVRPTLYRDAYAVAIGTEYHFSDLVTVRGGIHYDTTPTVDAYRDTTVPDADRLWLGIGATYPWTQNVMVDFAFNHVFFTDTNIGITRTFFDGTPLATAVRINAVAKSAIDTVSLGVRYAF